MKSISLPVSILVIAATRLAPAIPGPEHPLQSAPRVSSFSTEDLPQPTLLGSPEVRTLVGYTRRVLHLHDSHTLALFSFAGSNPANWLFLVDSRDLSVQRHPIPNNDVGSHGAALGIDGNIYIMPYGTERAYQFDVEKKTFKQLATGLPKGEYTWDAFGASNGCVYFGTYPNAYLGEYNIKTGACELWKQAVPGKKYTRFFSETTEGTIQFAGWGPGRTSVTFDPKSRKIHSDENQEHRAKRASKADHRQTEKSSSIPESDNRLSGHITLGTRTFAIGFPTSRLWELSENGKWLFRGDPNAAAEAWFLEQVPGAIVGISHFGVIFRFDLTTSEFSRNQIDNLAPGGNSIMFVESVLPDTVIGANYSQQNLWKMDVETGDITSSEGMVARVTGEPMCGIGFDGLAYIGIYVSSLISVYDPNRPFEFGTNPRELIELGETYKQTRPRDTATDGELVFISSDSAYSRLGGALAVVDPETKNVDVYHHLIEDQNLPTLAYDPVTRLLWGGTDRWGQMRSHPPTQASSLVYAFDPEVREVVARLIPWPGADVTDVLGILPGGVLVASASGEIAFIDTKTRDILFRGKPSFVMPRKIKTGANGKAYSLVEGNLCRWDLKNNVLIPVSSAPGCRFFTEPSPGLWILADAVSVYRVHVEFGVETEHGSLLLGPRNSERDDPKAQQGDRIANPVTNEQ